MRPFTAGQALNGLLTGDNPSATVPRRRIRQVVEEQAGATDEGSQGIHGTGPSSNFSDLMAATKKLSLMLGLAPVNPTNQNPS